MKKVCKFWAKKNIDLGGSVRNNEITDFQYKASDDIVMIYSLSFVFNFFTSYISGELCELFGHMVAVVPCMSVHCPDSFHLCFPYNRDQQTRARRASSKNNEICCAISFHCLYCGILAHCNLHSQMMAFP